MDKHLNVRYILVTTTIGLLNSFLYDNFPIMAALCVVEVLILLLSLVRRNYVNYVCYYLIFLTFSMESGNFVGVDAFYGFKNFRVAGANVAVWMLLPLLCCSIKDLKTLRLLSGDLLSELLSKLSFFTISGALMGILVYAIDDYGFSSKTGSLKEMINSYYAYLLPFISIVVVSWALLKDSANLPKARQYLFSCIPATAIVFIACMAFGNYGNRMGVASLQVSEIYFLLIASLVLISYKNFDKKEKIIIIISGAIIAVLSLMFNASGKIIIILIFVPIVWLYILKKLGRTTAIALYIVLAFCVLVFVPQFELTILGSDNMVLQSKMEDVSGLMNFGSNNWLMQIPASPRMRITEFMNVGYEYWLHPWYVIFGKGFCGCIQDSLGLFSFLDESAFSIWELELGAYKGMHESFNTFFLVGGITGLYILFSLIGKIYRRMYISPWLMFGGLWLFLFYGYHMNVSIFGITSLVVGLIEASSYKIKQ